MSIYFRPQMALLKYTNLRGFFREVDKKRTRLVRLVLPDMNDYYRAMMIKYANRLIVQGRKYRHKYSYIWKHKVVGGFNK